MHRLAFLKAGAVALLGHAPPRRTLATLTPGTELDYAQITANVNVSHLEASADVILTGSPITLDGVTRIRVEFYAQVVETPSNGYDFNLGLFEGSSIVRLLVGRYTSAGGVLDVEANGVCYLTPSAGTHTYSIRAYRSPGTSGTAIVAAGDGVGDDFPPAFYRVTVA